MVVPRRVAVPLIVAGILVPIGLAGCGSSYSSDGGESNADRYDTTTVAAAAASSATVTLMADPNGALMFDTTTLTAKAGTRRGRWPGRTNPRVAAMSSRRGAPSGSR
jgi:hypothetical protein